MFLLSAVSVVALCFVNPSMAFTVPASHAAVVAEHHGKNLNPSATATRLRSTERDDEIARLEEQLRKLKEEQTEDEVSTSTDEVEVPSTETTASSFTTISPSQQDKIFVDRQVILSEKELLDANIMDEDSGLGAGDFIKLGFAALALVGLIAFSQVPVGQENLAKYSATGSSSIKGGQIDLGDLNMDVRR